MKRNGSCRKRRVETKKRNRTLSCGKEIRFPQKKTHNTEMVTNISLLTKMNYCVRLVLAFYKVIFQKSDKTIKKK